VSGIGTDVLDMGQQMAAQGQVVQDKGPAVKGGAPAAKPALQLQAPNAIGGGGPFQKSFLDGDFEFVSSPVTYLVFKCLVILTLCDLLSLRMG
jgi:hypothetical protein